VREHEMITLVFESDGGAALSSLDGPKVSSLLTTFFIFE